MTAVGFTGTQRGLTPEQGYALKALFRKLFNGEEGLHVFRHGDCVGADAQAHVLVAEVFPLVRIEVHPPRVLQKRAFCKGAVIHTPDSYLKRNRTIVEMSEVLVACPWDAREIPVSPEGWCTQGSGTWTTVKYALQAVKTVHVVCSNGTVLSVGGK